MLGIMNWGVEVSFHFEVMLLPRAVFDYNLVLAKMHRVTNSSKQSKLKPENVVS